MTGSTDQAVMVVCDEGYSIGGSITGPAYCRSNGAFTIVECELVACEDLTVVGATNTISGFVNQSKAVICNNG